jgi:phenylpropionate dioxygenase-like ring-hydroxylating dioxygenase large terminal subunit
MMALPGTHKRTLKANWKFAAEQFGGDNYHTMWAHESGVRTSIAQQFGGEHPWTNDWEAKTKESHRWINFAFEDPPGVAELIGPYTARLREGKVIELQEVVAGRASGHEGDDQITLFKSVGTAVQDVTAGYAVYQEARRLGIGSEVPDFLELKTF